MDIINGIRSYFPTLPRIRKESNFTQSRRGHRDSHSIDSAIGKTNANPKKLRGSVALCEKNMLKVIHNNYAGIRVHGNIMKHEKNLPTESHACGIVRTHSMRFRKYSAQKGIKTPKPFSFVSYVSLPILILLLSGCASERSRETPRSLPPPVKQPLYVPGPAYHPDPC